MDYQVCSETLPKPTENQTYNISVTNIENLWNDVIWHSMGIANNTPRLRIFDSIVDSIQDRQTRESPVLKIENMLEGLQNCYRCAAESYFFEFF